ncbi:major facilitator superfamily domain-containing protein [Epithele typhae]|uniref:major facilitator superfamily domain-containing protein n=1 Tax=Epithele typhae TaxID=378194 RepID=UPI0020088181|nr:major facilitator superfamily domain-containing protein [Epithele typhae]KAH9933585.1 major facilitator superfamily domain-containing protein [Epithele typhae]
MPPPASAKPKPVLPTAPVSSTDTALCTLRRKVSCAFSTLVHRAHSIPPDAPQPRPLSNMLTREPTATASGDVSDAHAEDGGKEDPETAERKRRSRLSYTAVVVCNFLSALDVTAVSTALPTIIKDLNGGEEFVWLADIIGHCPIMLTCVGFFFLGSLLRATAQNMHWLIAARTVQGIGREWIINLASIITSDLVPLADRGLYQGLLVLTWASAAGIEPVIKVTWRWLFYLNLPLAGIAFSPAMIFLRVRTPEGNLREKVAHIDLVGDFIIIAGTTLTFVALTWGGIRYPWNSAHVLAPLILGLPLRGVCREASNRTSLVGYIGTFLHGIASIAGAGVGMRGTDAQVVVLMYY